VLILLFVLILSVCIISTWLAKETIKELSQYTDPERQNASVTVRRTNSRSTNYSTIG